MLPFWPESAPSSEHYAKWMRGSIQARGTAMSRRQPALLATWSFNDAVRSAFISPDGSRIAFGVASSVYVTSEATGRPVVGPLKHKSSVPSVAFSPDGRLVVSGFDGKTIRVWSTQTGQSTVDPFAAHGSLVSLVTFSPNATSSISCSADRNIRVRDVESGQTIVEPLEDHTNGVCSVSFSPDGTRIASGSRDKAVRVWDAHSGQAVLGPLEGHNDDVTSVCYSPDGWHTVRHLGV